MWKRKLLLCVLVGLVISAVPLPELVLQSAHTVTITSPSEGQVLSGIVDVIGTSEITGFSHSELQFSNANGPIETWFPISSSKTGVETGLLFTWDTTLITDGDYRLRLVVVSDDRSISEFVISFISIRNYTPSMKPSPTISSIFLTPTATNLSPTDTPEIRPTALPENPLSLSLGDLAKSLAYGILTILSLIGISIVYSRRQQK